MRLVQLQHPARGRRAALVDHESLILLHESHTTLYDLVWDALAGNAGIRERVGNSLSPEILSYDSVYSGREKWRLLPSFDHPRDPPSLCSIRNRPYP